MKDLSLQLQQLRAQNLYRSRRVLTGPQGAEVDSDGRRYLAFCSNDYLDLAIIRLSSAPCRLPPNATAWAVAPPIWSAATAMNTMPWKRNWRNSPLAQGVAVFHRYMANLGVISALLGRGDTVYEDRLNHALCWMAGCLPAHACSVMPCRCAGADAAAGGPGRRRGLDRDDGVFSMDGDLAPLPALATVAGDHGAWLMVDDAHGFA